MCASECLLVSVGIIFVTFSTIWILKEIFRWIKLYLLPNFIKQDLKKYGEWAVITGGCSGIGKHTAIELAKSGLKLILISNELEQLQATVKDIETKFGVECCYVLADLTGGKEVYDCLWSKIEGKDVGIFVNCAGIAGRTPCYFLDETESNTLVMIALNVETVVNMTYRMSNLYAKKNKGVIINVSSASSIFLFSYYAIYCSCKRFMDVFSKGVNEELIDKGINLQSLLPYFVHTRMTNKMKKNMLIPSCKKFCENWIKCIGKNQSYAGYWLHEIIIYILSFCPSFFLNYMTKNICISKYKKRINTSKSRNNKKIACNPICYY
ncbi:very-long-chain 3-oxoacyl-CoA reductase-like [Centruroides sculpturatus]|uniref:very-long-chain 3-oxoacyl-CoA reductase-like n=1 Tax=Centruroides sculpturatus TaxID=218467 RepID=UPI000C6E136F|nr:very-long-chain 3-oxoacyl-CoA reductase-like [Centruroides sculpturatus]